MAPWSGRRQQCLRHAPRAVADRARGAADRDAGARDGVDVAAPPERVADVLALELRRKFRPVDRSIAVGLAMLDDDDAGEDPFRVHPDEDLDGSVVPALERLELPRPESQAR